MGSDLHRPLFGKITICFVFNNLIAYISLATSFFSRNFTDLLPNNSNACILMGFFTFYTITSFMFWINAMALNIFMRFSSKLASRSENKRAKFISYFLYAQVAMMCNNKHTTFASRVLLLYSALSSLWWTSLVLVIWSFQAWGWLSVSLVIPGETSGRSLITTMCCLLSSTLLSLSTFTLFLFFSSWPMSSYSFWQLAYWLIIGDLQRSSWREKIRKTF